MMFALALQLALGTIGLPMRDPCTGDAGAVAISDAWINSELLALGHGRELVCRTVIVPETLEGMVAAYAAETAEQRLAEDRLQVDRSRLAAESAGWTRVWVERFERGRSDAPWTERDAAKARRYTAEFKASLQTEPR